MWTAMLRAIVGASILFHGTSVATPIDSSPHAALNFSSGFLIQHASLTVTSESPFGAIGVFDEFLSVAGKGHWIEMDNLGENRTAATLQPQPSIVWTIAQQDGSSGLPSLLLRNDFTRLCLDAHLIEDMDYFVGGRPCNASDVNQQWRLLKYATVMSRLLFFELQHAVHGAVAERWCVRVPSTTKQSANAVLDTCSGGQMDLERHTYFLVVPAEFT